MFSSFCDSFTTSALNASLGYFGELRLCEFLGCHGFQPWLLRIIEIFNKPVKTLFFFGNRKAGLGVVQIKQAAVKLFGMNTAQHRLVNLIKEHCVFVQTDRKEFVIDLDRFKYAKCYMVSAVPVRGDIARPENISQACEQELVTWCVLFKHAFVPIVAQCSLADNFECFSNADERTLVEIICCQFVTLLKLY